MQSAAVVALALLESVQAFQAPAMAPRSKAVAAQMFSEGDIGVLPPLGVYDPLGLIEKRDMRRYEIMEIKHGRGTQPPPRCLRSRHVAWPPWTRLTPRGLPMCYV